MKYYKIGFSALLSKDISMARRYKQSEQFVTMDVFVNFFLLQRAAFHRDATKPK